MRFGPLGQLLHTGTKRTPPCRFSNRNLLQLTFPTQKPYTLKDHSAFAFALYLTSVTHPGRPSPTVAPPTSHSYPVSCFPFSCAITCLPPKLTPKDFHLKLHHMLDTDDPTLVDIPELPPLMLDQSFFMPVSPIRSFFQTVTRVPFYRFPKTLGWPTMDVTLEPATSPASPSFSHLHSFFAILPNFFPPSVRALLSSYKTDDAHGPSHFYTSEAYAHLQQLNIRPGTSSSSMDIEYTWPVNWDIPDFTSILEPLYFMHSLHSTHPNLLPLLRSLGQHFLRSLTSALLASNQHFPSLLLATLYGLRSGHTTLCVEGIFGARKTFSASLLLIVLSTILDVNTLLSAEPNLPLATAIENIDLLLQDASDDVRAQYGRILANHVKVSSKLDMTPLDRQASFKADSPKRCILVTQGSLLRDLCRDHPQLQSFIQSCRVAINDEAQQGGQAGFTVLTGFLSIHCLQILTGDKEQNRSGTGGEPTKEALLERLALKSVGFLNNTTALFPWEFAKDVGRALRQFQPFTSSLPTVPDVHCLLASLSSCALPPALSPSTVHQAEGMTPTRGVTLSLILPQSLRCPADPYFTQVATHYPHLHRLEDNNVEYGHYEDQPAEVQESRLYHDMRNHPHHCSGYRVIHWNPNLAQNSIHLQPSSINTIIRILAVISYFTARAVRLDEESSKLLILAPHNDTIDDLEGKLGAPAPNYPPTLFDFYLVCIYRRYYLPTNCDKFQYTNSQGNTVTPVPQGVSTADIHRYITGNEALKEDLQSRASISLIVELATSYPRGFATYCTVSNTVRAIGIGGTASLFLSAKMFTFLAASPAADARNLVALTRSKGLSVLLLPTTQKFIDCSLHSILTQCAWRHGIFHVGTADLDTQALADYISQPDTTLNDQPSVFTSESWLYTHQITSFGRWDPLPLCLCLSQGTLVSYFCLSLNQHLPPANTAEISASSFEWKGLTPGPPNEPASIVFGRDSLVLTTEHAILAEFPYPTLDTTDPLTSTRYTLLPAAGSHFFARSSHSQGHKHPLRPSPPASHIPAPLCLQRWPSTSPAAVSPDLPSQASSPPPQFLGAAAKSLFLSGIEYLHSQDCIADPNLSAEAWLAAYGAHIIPNFSQEHCTAPVDPQVIRRFHDEVVTPLSTRHDTEAIFQFFHNVLSAQQLTINWTIVMPRHRTAHTSEPPEDDLVKVLPRTSYPTLPTWIDNLVTKINHLVQLLTNADDLPRSAHGWVFLRALRRYDGPAVPGNQDPQTNQIVHSHPFSLTSRNSAIDFTEKVLGGMAAYDRRKRLTLGEAIDHNNKASIVVALTSQLPKRILISIHQPVPRAHLNTVDPIPLAALPPFGVYYCHTTTFERILREGIRPGVHSSRATDPRHIGIKLQASREDTMSREVLTSPLNQRRFSVAIFVAIPSTARSGSQWFWVDIENNIVGTPTIPLESAHFHCALSLDNDRVVHHWLPTSTDPRTRGRPIDRGPSTGTHQPFNRSHDEYQR